MQEDLTKQQCKVAIPRIMIALKGTFLLVLLKKFKPEMRKSGQVILHSYVKNSAFAH